MPPLHGESVEITLIFPWRTYFEEFAIKILHCKYILCDGAGLELNLNRVRQAPWGTCYAVYPGADGLSVPTFLHNLLAVGTVQTYLTTPGTYSDYTWRLNIIQFLVLQLSPGVSTGLLKEMFLNLRETK